MEMTISQKILHDLTVVMRENLGQARLTNRLLYILLLERNGHMVTREQLDAALADLAADIAQVPPSTPPLDFQSEADTIAAMKAKIAPLIPPAPVAPPT